VTSASGSTAPVASKTIPVTVPVPICGNVLLTFRADTPRQKRKRRKILLLKILSALNIVDNPTP
jgi:hypothetical protein